MRRSIALSLLGSLATLWCVASEGLAQAPLTFDVASNQELAGETKPNVGLQDTGMTHATDVS